MRRVLAWIAGPALAAFFLWLCFRGVDLAELWQVVRHVDPLLLGLSVASVFAHLGLRSWRWRTLLAPVAPDVPYRELLSAVSIGYMASLLPGRVGEVLRPALLSRRTGTPFAAALATVGVERAVLDLLAIVVLGGGALLLPPGLSGVGAHADPELVAFLRVLGGGLLAGGLAALAIVTWLARDRERWEERFRRFAEGEGAVFLRRPAGFVAGLFPGLGAFATMRGLAAVLAETFVIWGVIAAGIQAGIASCGVTLAPFSALVMLPILAVGIGIPTPGGTGSYHAAMTWGLAGLFGTPRVLAGAAGLVVHAFTWLPVLAAGGLFVALGGLARGEAAAVPAGEAAP